MKKVVILNSINHYRNFTSIKKNNESKNAFLFIAMKIEVRIFLTKRRVKFSIPEQYINEIQAEELDEKSLDIAYNWHNDKFLYDRISLGRLVAWNNIYYFSRILRDFQIILNLIEREDPYEIISYEDNELHTRDFNKILQYVCSLKEIQFNKYLMKSQLIKQPKSKKSLEFLIINFIGFKINTIPSQEPFKRMLHFFSFLFSKVSFCKLYGKNNSSKNVLMDNSFRYESLKTELTKDKQFKILLLSEKATLKSILENFKNKILKKRILHIFLDNYRKKSFSKNTRLFIVGIQKQWKKYINDPKFIRNFDYNGHSLWPLVKDYILRIIYVDFKRIIENIQIINEIYKKKRIDLITFNDDTTEFTKCLATVASNLKIHSLVLQHGAISYFYSIGFLPLTAEKIAVWGKISKNNLTSFGISPEKAIITGAPRFDIYSKLIKNKKLLKKIKEKVYKDFKLNSKTKLIVYASSFVDFQNMRTNLHLTRDELIKILECILNTMKNFPNSHLIIKLHYADNNPQIPVKIINYLGIRNVSVVKSYNLANLLVSCDCLITPWSTVGSEAMIFKKPLISVRIRKKKYPVPYTESNAAFEASNVEELTEKLRIVFHNPLVMEKDQEKYVKNDLFKIDGLATKRVSNLIKEMIMN